MAKNSMLLFILVIFASIVLVSSFALIVYLSSQNSDNAEEKGGIQVTEINTTLTKLASPQYGYFYHGVYPGRQSGEEDDITLSDVKSYEESAGKEVAWVYFSNNWYNSREFPYETASWIRNSESVPYIRLMLRSSPETGVDEPVFKPERIVNGEFDRDLKKWFRDAKSFGTPLIVEYGTEMNAEWFPWNGIWNGGGVQDSYRNVSYPDGPERFRDAYKHIINISKEEGAYNIVWVFHINAADSPSRPWNYFENYYPGDNYIDWIGVSVYGAQTPAESQWLDFRKSFDPAYTRIALMTTSKPIIISEFGFTSGISDDAQKTWTENALKDIINQRWPRVIGFSWWNSAWQNDDNPSHDSDMLIQDNPELAKIFQKYISNSRVLSSQNISVVNSD